MVPALLHVRPIAYCEEAAMADDRDPNTPNVDDEIGKAANEDVTAPSNHDEDEFEDTEDLDANDTAEDVEE
jgi:hypothetical protein